MNELIVESYRKRMLRNISLFLCFFLANHICQKAGKGFISVLSNLQINSFI